MALPFALDFGIVVEDELLNFHVVQFAEVSVQTNPIAKEVKCGHL